MRKTNASVLFTALVLIVITWACGTSEISQTVSSADSTRIAEGAIAQHKDESHPVKKPMDGKEIDSQELNSMIDRIDLSNFNFGEYSVNVPYLKVNTTLSINELKWDIQNSLNLNEKVDIVVAKIHSRPKEFTKFLNNNKEVLSQALAVSGAHDEMSTLFERIKYWQTNQKPQIAKQFEKFYQKYGSLERFPSEGYDSTSTGLSFWKDMHKIIDTDPDFFPDGRDGFVPRSYLDWLFVRRWKSRIGVSNFDAISEEVDGIISQK